MSIPIKRFVDRVPGGMMTLPLAAGALLARSRPMRQVSLVPSLAHSLPVRCRYLRSSTSASAPLFQFGLFRACFEKGGVLLGTKVLLGVAVGVFVGHWIGIEPIAAGWFSGFSTLAVVAAINDTNGGLYMALMNQYGRAEDAAAYSVMSLESGPFLTMVTLGVAGLSAFPWQALVGASCRSPSACFSGTSIPNFANSSERPLQC